MNVPYIRQYVRRNNKTIGCLVSTKDENGNVKIGVSFLNPKDEKYIFAYNKRVKVANGVSWEERNRGGDCNNFPIEPKRKAFDKNLAVEIALKNAHLDVENIKRTKLKHRELEAFIARSKKYFKDGIFNY